jgi:integrase
MRYKETTVTDKTPLSIKVEEISRGLTVEECLSLCKAPSKLPLNATRFQMWNHLRDGLLVRLIYETWARIAELLKVEIQDVDFEQCAIYIKHPKSKAIFKKIEGVRTHVETVYSCRWVFFSDYTRDLLIRYLEGRKKGYLILSNRGKALSTRQAERIVDHYAKMIGIQKVIGYTSNGREVHLVTCKAMREAGERHTDVSGGDRDITARIAGHTVETKEAYYKKSNFEEMRDVVRRHHPLMREE